MDNGQPEPFTSTAEVIITVFSPDNFFNPQLDQVAYSAIIDENESTGSLVLRFNVSDSDLFGTASEIGVATILGLDAQFFNVTVTGPNTGEIRSK